VTSKGTKLKVSEIFGPTVQGEGKNRGQLCYFIRLYDCNLTCSWCDTSYTWANTKSRAEKTQSGTLFPKDENLKEMTVSEIFEELKTKCGLDVVTSDPVLFIISGGEPLMQQDALVELTDQLKDWEHELHIETAGTIEPYSALWNNIDFWTVSPKLQHSGNLLKKRYKPDVLRAFAARSNVSFKFVVMHGSGMDGEDFFEIDKMVEEIEIDKRQVMIMPEGSDPDGQISGARSIIQPTLDRGYGFSFRDHILLWKDKRGV
jgi:7-carboxy-7-deazaguanine synthase